MHFLYDRMDEMNRKRPRRAYRNGMQSTTIIVCPYAAEAVEKHFFFLFSFSSIYFNHITTQSVSPRKRKLLQKWTWHDTTRWRSTSKRSKDKRAASVVCVRIIVRANVIIVVRTCRCMLSQRYCLLLQFIQLLPTPFAACVPKAYVKHFAYFFLCRQIDLNWFEARWVGNKCEMTWAPSNNEDTDDSDLFPILGLSFLRCAIMTNGK